MRKEFEAEIIIAKELTGEDITRIDYRPFFLERSVDQYRGIFVWEIEVSPYRLFKRYEYFNVLNWIDSSLLLRRQTLNGVHKLYCLDENVEKLLTNLLEWYKFFSLVASFLDDGWLLLTKEDHIIKGEKIILSRDEVLMTLESDM